MNLELDGIPISIARTGYTGEDGVEVFFRAADAPTVWKTVLSKGAAFEIRALRPWRQRHSAVGDVLPVEWLRPFTRTQSD